MTGFRIDSGMLSRDVTMPGRLVNRLRPIPGRRVRIPPTHCATSKMLPRRPCESWPHVSVPAHEDAVLEDGEAHLNVAKQSSVHLRSAERDDSRCGQRRESVRDRIRAASNERDALYGTAFCE